jgi:biopolymer transport protein TolQ
MVCCAPHRSPTNGEIAGDRPGVAAKVAVERQPTQGQIMNPAEIAAAPLAAPAADITIWTMFWGAHIVVKAVMLGLLAASVWCWAIIIDKTLLFARLRRSMDRFEENFWSGNSLEELYGKLSERPQTGMATLFVAAMREWKRSFQAGASASFMGLQARIEKVLDVSIAREVEKLESNLLVLATVASAGPFVGLFGTVWGIMDAFYGIGLKGAGDIGALAPGLAAALINTISGLFVAIPAVIAYNYFSDKIHDIAIRCDSFSMEFLSFIERRLLRKKP